MAGYGMARPSPRQAAKNRSTGLNNQAYYDTTGMDPEMAQTLKGEAGRRGLVSAATTPAAVGTDRGFKSIGNFFTNVGKFFTKKR